MLTTQEMNRAIRLATDHLVEEFRQNLEIQPARRPDVEPYGIIPAGWTLFVVVESDRVGASKYVAVNLETCETKSLGTIGD